MSASDAPWLDRAREDIGVKEVAGRKSNPRIIEMGQLAGIDWYKSDETAWCAVAVNAWLVEAGHPSTKSALARSFVTYGRRMSTPVPGAIVVFPRGSNPLYGHVAVVESYDRAKGTVTCINGNVGNAVKRSTFKVSTILPDGIRWPPDAGAPSIPTLTRGPKTLRSGDAGEEVEELQATLHRLGYLKANNEGVNYFGPKTEVAVRNFQRDQGIVVDGIVGPATLSALGEAKSVKTAKVEKRSAQAEGSLVGVVGTGSVIVAATSQAEQMTNSARGFSEAIQTGGPFLLAILVAVAAGVAFYFWRKSRRVAE